MTTTIKTKEQSERERLIERKEFLKTCPKEQAKLERQLRKLGLM